MFGDLDIALRAAAVALFVLWAVLLWRDARERVGSVFALGVASYAICSAPDFMAPTGFGWRLPVLALCVGNPVMFWLFARRLFDDGFKPALVHWLGWCGYALVGLAVILSAQGPFAANRSSLYVLLTVGTMVFAAAAAWVAWRGHGDDLVEQRRRVRPIMMSGAILYVLSIAAAELGLRGAPPPLALGTLNAGVLAAFAFATLVVFSRGEGAELFAPARPAPFSRPPPTRPSEVGRDALAARLEALFVEERIYREAELSIAEVARWLGVPQHRLRVLINQTLGHRNFAAFVNGFRLAEAKIALADPGQAEVPIATIALDSGFGSLNAFNRAFKADVGQTPSSYREQARSAQ